jgi:hypothetical protein
MLRHLCPGGSHTSPSDIAQDVGDITHTPAPKQRRTARSRNLRMVPQTPTPTVGLLAEEYLSDLWRRSRLPRNHLESRTPETCRVAASRLRLLSDDLRATPLLELTRAAVRRWHRALAERPHRRTGDPATGAADGALKQLAAVIQWAITEELLPRPALGVELTNPCRGVSRLHRVQRAVPFSDEEFAAFRAALATFEANRLRPVHHLDRSHPRHIAARTVAAALRLADLVIARPSEIAGLRRTNVDEQQSLLVLDASKNDRENDVGLMRPLSADALDVIRLQLDGISADCPFIFPSIRCHGQIPIDYQTMASAFRDVCALAGFERGRFSLYSLRRGGVDFGYRSGAPSSAIAAAAGHRKEMSFEVYRSTLPAGAHDLAEAHARRGRPESALETLSRLVREVSALLQEHGRGPLAVPLTAAVRELTTAERRARESRRAA